MLELLITSIIILAIFSLFASKGPQRNLIPNRDEQIKDTGFSLLPSQTLIAPVQDTPAPDPLRSLMDKLTGDSINGFVSAKAMFFDNQAFDIDYFVFVPKVGFVVIETCNDSGTVYCTADNKWTKTQAGTTDGMSGNLSKKALRTRALVKKLLKTENQDNWPILPLVIYTNDNAKVMSSKNSAPQTPVIRLDMFSKWLGNLSKNSKYNFSQSDFNQINSLISINGKSKTQAAKKTPKLEYPNNILYSEDGNFPAGFKVQSQIGSISLTGRGYKNVKQQVMDKAKESGGNAVIITSAIEEECSKSVGSGIKVTMRGKIYSKPQGTYKWNEITMNAVIVKVARYTR